MRTAQERAVSAKLAGTAKARRRDGLASRLGGGLHIATCRLQGLLQARRVERPRQQIIECHIAARQALLPGQAGNESGQATAGTVG
ncbi:hypothetical protein D3C71_1958830 [compost metagenome]